MHWGGNTQLRRVDSGVADLIVSDGQSYLLPLSNYADSVIKYLTSRRALKVRSAVDARGFRCLCYGTDVTVFQTALRDALDRLRADAG